METIHAWALAMLSTCPVGARVDVYENVEVLRKSFIKENKDVVSEKTVMPSNHTGGVAAAVAQPIDASVACAVGEASETGPEGRGAGK